MLDYVRSEQKNPLKIIKLTTRVKKNFHRLIKNYLEKKRLAFFF